VEVLDDTAADFQAALTLLQQDRFPEAEVLLLEITASQPELAGPWFNLGKVYLALERPEDARFAFEQAALANPRNCAVLNELGVLSRRAGDFEAAETRYLQCIEVRPDDAIAHLNLGILYELYLGRLADALDHYRRYQSMQSEPDRKVAGWVVDLERRLGV
jgi:Flp pilus assembly protein TadD